MTNLRSLSDLFRAAMKLAAACAFATAIAAAAFAQTNTFPENGNAGVGTTTPSYPLTVNQTGNSINRLVGLANDSSGSSAQAAFSFFEGTTEKFKFGMNSSGATGYVGGANAFQLWQFQNAPIVFGTNSSERMRINGAGNIGIGTTSPQTRFDIKQSSDTFVGGLHLRRSSTNDTWALVTGNDNSLYMGYANNASGADAASDFTVYPLVLTSTGNVGIGTAVPGGKLGVLSNDSTTNGVSELLRLSHTTTGTAANGVGSRIAFTAERASGIEVLTGYIDSILTDATNVDSALLFHTRDNGGSLTERVRIDSVGNVGIGTTPGALYRLDVQGKINSSELCIATDCKSSWSQVGGGGGSTAFSSITAGTNTVALVVGNSGSLGVSGTGTINATSLTNAANITSGTVPITRLGTGTPDSTKFLRGDNTWTAITSSQWTTGAGNISYTAGNVGIGVTPNSSYKLDVAGNINSSGTITGNIINAKYQDLAEWVSSSEQLSAGTVVVLDTTKSNQVISSAVSYDTRVAGVISAQPGITLGESGEGKVLVATTGRVRVKVDASRGPIQIGDLLVTSDISGVAMKSEPLEFAGRKMHMPGTIIGKALEPLAKGQSEILVLLSLQ